MTLSKSELLDSLAKYGYSLVRPMATEDPEALLRSLVEQDDARLMEGFPVVLANAMKKKVLKWESGEQKLKGRLSGKVREKFVCLLALSYHLFKLFGLETGFQNRVKTLLNQLDQTGNVLKDVEEDFMNSKPVRADGVVFSTDRLKNTFRNYVLHPVDDREVERKKHELQLELLLSELFTLKQKSLIKKKLAGTSLSKTEREYFSRVVKKRLKALANVELQRLAAQLLNK